MGGLRPGLFVGLGLVSVAIAWDLERRHLDRATTVPEADERVAAPAPEPVGPALGREVYLDGILRRNVFDVASLEAWTAHGPAPAAAAARGADLELELLGTLVATPRRYSSALVLELRGSGLPRGYSVGDRVGELEVLAIEHHRVALRSALGVTEWLAMDEPDGTVVQDTGDAMADAGGERVPVDRATFDELLGALAGPSKPTNAHVMLHRGSDGRFDGFRVSSIRPGAVFERIGIEDGDVVRSMGGQELVSMRAATSAASALRASCAGCLRVDRGGVELQRCYEVRPATGAPAP